MTPTPTPRAPGRGFTLLELLIAISVLSLVSIIAWRGLDSLVTTRARLAPEGDEVRALLTAFGQLERDLSHVPNPVLFGLRASPVAVRPTTTGPVLEIVRIAPPDETGATAVQQVFYRVDDGALLRTATSATRAIGPVDAEQLNHARLLGAVKSLRIRLWQPGAGWVAAEQGAAQPLPPGQAPAPPPGIEVSVERLDGKTYRRVLLVG